MAESSDKFVLGPLPSYVRKPDNNLSPNVDSVPVTNNSVNPNPQGQQFQIISADNISAIIKEAVGGIKDYVDQAIASQKEATSKVIESVKVNFKFKGNKLQFEFNNSQLERVQTATNAIKKGDTASAILELQKVEDDILKRNKLIRIADKSEDGWKVVDEYLSEELASDSDDDKKIRAAQNRAASKRKKAKSNRSKATPYKSQRRPQETFPNPDATFRSYMQQGRPQFNQVHTLRSFDLCFGCGKSGHWRRNCPNTKPTKEGTGL
nr:uncharacterized protein LOC129279877 [Lytechinus pictus]